MAVSASGHRLLPLRPPEQPIIRPSKSSANAQAYRDPNEKCNALRQTVNIHSLIPPRDNTHGSSWPLPMLQATSYSACTGILPPLAPTCDPGQGDYARRASCAVLTVCRVASVPVLRLVSYRPLRQPAPAGLEHRGPSDQLATFDAGCAFSFISFSK